MVQKPGNFPIKETSDIPLAGPIVGLHVIVHERTKGSYIVGGVDDGSIAIWALEFVLMFFVFETSLDCLFAAR